jgi:pyruvate kinase
MVARGDLGVEIDYEKLPGIQKRIIHECYKRGKISVTATQMLESMIENPTPTRAEITDIANAVFDGTSAVMLSGESAAGKYPVRAVEAMSRIAIQAEEDAFLADLYSHRQYAGGTTDTTAIAHAACTTARDLSAKCILAITKSGTTARRVSKYRPKELIVACTPEEKSFHQLALVWGVTPIKTHTCNRFSELLQACMESVVEYGLAKSGDKIVATAGVPLNEAGRTNLIRVEMI